MHRITATFTHLAAQLRPAAALWGRIHSATLIRTRGRVGRTWFGAPMLVLVTRGRKTGKVRRTPLLYARDGESYILLAANGGNDRAPSWWANLRAAPTAEVLVKGEALTVTWREVPAGEEYARLYAAIEAAYPPAEHYPGFTERHLPIAVLTPA